MRTKLYMPKEAASFMMSFVITTSKNNVIIIDGGRKTDMPGLKEYVNGRHVSAWILTHPHMDHISGFISEMEENGGADFDIEKVYYNFPDYDYLISKKESVCSTKSFIRDLNETLPYFNANKDKFKDKTHIVRQNESITIDEVKIEFLYTIHDGLYNNVINDSSLAFKVTTPTKTMMFLGDLGPEGGDILLHENWHKLKADYVQMAHHGHMAVSMEVYAAIMPEVCFWPTPLWLYDQEIIPRYCEGDTDVIRKNGTIRKYGDRLTRDWMVKLGVTQNYVSGAGSVEVDL